MIQQQINKKRYNITVENNKQRGKIDTTQKEMKNADYKSKGLYFRVSVLQGLGRRVYAERTFKEFLYLRSGLARAFPGCYVPKMVSNDLHHAAVQIGLGTELPTGQGYVEKRKELTQIKLIEGFCEKLKECPYLVESDIFKLFMNKQVTSQLDI